MEPRHTDRILTQRGRFPIPKWLKADTVQGVPCLWSVGNFKISYDKKQLVIRRNPHTYAIFTLYVRDEESGYYVCAADMPARKILRRTPEKGEEIEFKELTPALEAAMPGAVKDFARRRADHLWGLLTAADDDYYDQQQ